MNLGSALIAIGLGIIVALLWFIDASEQKEPDDKDD